MKKNNLKVFIAFLILSFLFLFSCKQQESMKEYIERGFSRPTIEDVHFTKEKTGNMDKIYVPSEEEIEIQFEIKNRYNKELAGEVELPQDKNALFEKAPYIKELTATKMVIALKFKTEAEPKKANNFFGESVGITVKIFEKNTGRFLNSRAITANCNTAPPSMKIEDIEYKAETDEYIVTLPKEEGIHKDLREVHFTLSSDYGKPAAEPKVMSIANISEQGTKHTLKIKGGENWQLDSPSGQRTIKAIVYDKAGLRSDEKNRKTTRYFTTINLKPDKTTVTLTEARNGVPIPKIVELEEFFKGDNWQKETGYSVAYTSATPNGFVYDSETKTLKHPSPTAETTYQVTVALTQGSLHSTPVTKTFEITVVADNKTSVKTTITDATTYGPDDPNTPNAPLKLQFTDSNLSSAADPLNSSIQVITVSVPYTGQATVLGVALEADSALCKGKDGHDANGTDWEDVWEKGYGITLGEYGGSTKEIKFTIIAADGHTTQYYTLKFERENPINVTLKFEEENLYQGSKTEAKMDWGYVAENFSFTVTGENSAKEKIKVGKNKAVKFDITAKEGVKITEAKSSLGNPPHGVITISSDGKSISQSLNATEDFTLTVKLAPEASIKWENYNSSDGYTDGKIVCTRPNETDSTGITSDLHKIYAVKKGSSIKCRVKVSDAENKFVEMWKVNGNNVISTDSDFALNEDKTELTIKNAKKDYVVSVVMNTFCKVNIKLKEGDQALTDHDCVIKVKRGTETLNPTNNAENQKVYEYKKIKPGETLTFTATPKASSTYEIEKWTYNETGVTQSQDLGTGAGNERTLQIDKNMDINVILKKKDVSLTVEFEKAGHNYLLGAKNISVSPEAILTDTSGLTGNKYIYKVKSGTKVKLTVTKKENAKIPYGIREWREKKSNDTFEQITDSEGKYEREIVVTKNTDLQIALINQYTFKFKKLTDDTDDGQMKITDTNNTELVAVGCPSNFEQTVQTDKTQVKFEVTGLSADKLVVSYKKEGTEDRSFFNNSTGMWKTEGTVSNLTPGDVFEVVVAKVKRIQLSVLNFDNNSYTGNFGLTIKKESNGTDHMLFPDRPSNNDIKITSNNRFDMYITKDTQIKFNMTLPNGHEIGAWREGTHDLSNTELNDIDKEDKVLIGKKTATYTCADYNNLELNACIREYETVELDFDMSKLSTIQGGNLSSVNVDGISIEASGREALTNTPIDLVVNKNKAEIRTRVRKGSKIKIKATAKKDDPKLYFAYWDIIPKGESKYKREYKAEPNYEITLNENYSIIGNYTDGLIVVVHNVREEDKNAPGNFPLSVSTGEWKLGRTRIRRIQYDSTYMGTDEKKKFPPVETDLDYTSENMSTSSGDRLVPLLEDKNTPPDHRVILISNINDQIRGIQLILEEHPSDVGFAHWRYSFGGDGDDTPKYDTTNPNAPGKPSQSGTSVRLGGRKNVNLPFFGVLHLWLYKATKTQTP